MKRVQVQLHVVASEQRCVVVDQQCRESEGKAKIEEYMSVSDEEAHQWHLPLCLGALSEPQPHHPMYEVLWGDLLQ